jgi:hypothetical protein
MKWASIGIGPKPADLPEWLAHASAETMRDGPFPLREILGGALYYPSCGSDGGPVQYLGPWFQSFVYVDYGYGRDDFLEQLVNAPFSGYQIMGMRSVSLNELAPRGWDQSALSQEENKHAMEYAKNRRKTPFCEWVVFERAAYITNSHRPQRFSLLYICADGAQAFNALYLGNMLRPGAIAVIQPGHGFGWNWTDFTDSRAVLARIVMGNPAGVPDYYIYGGRGARNDLTNPWPLYPTKVGWYKYHPLGDILGEVGVWTA